jgi:hypothetical protein
VESSPRVFAESYIRWGQRNQHRKWRLTSFSTTSGESLDVVVANLTRDVRVVICGAIAQHQKRLAASTHDAHIRSDRAASLTLTDVNIAKKDVLIRQRDAEGAMAYAFIVGYFAGVVSCILLIWLAGEMANR